MGRYGQLVNLGELFIILFLQFFFKLENFQNKKLERRENMLGEMRKAMAGRPGLKLRTLNLCGPS